MALNYCCIALNDALVGSKTDLCGIMGWFSGTAGWPPCPKRPLNRVRSRASHNGSGNPAVDNLKSLCSSKKNKNPDFKEGCLTIKLLSMRQKLCFESRGHSTTVRDE